MFKNCSIIKSLCVILLLLGNFPEATLRAQNADAEQSFFPGKFSNDSLVHFKKEAILAADQRNVVKAAYFVEEYIRYSAELSFLETSNFKPLQHTPEFKKLRKKYAFNFNWLHFFYLFSALSGFFIGLMIFLKKGNDKISAVLISLFVLMHSIFIFHIFLHNTNLKYQVPHILNMSTIFSFLYGPLLYFYFKRVALKYEFNKWDLLHLLPTLVIVVMMMPIYLLPASEKLNVMLHVSNQADFPPLFWGVVSKTLSLAIYGFLIYKIFLKLKKERSYSPDTVKWLHVLVVLAGTYVVSYIIYGLTISDVILRFDFLYHLQIIAMASMVLYIGYASFQQPLLFSSSFGRKKDKYTKSGLTPSYSVELKEQLSDLLENEKIYLKNDVSLDVIAERLNTTRHNASQVINEHFGLNFFDLINKYRIQDAVEILQNDTSRTIIDVAYQVGFNNKVTFNKSFKRFLSQTPTQYLGSL